MITTFVSIGMLSINNSTTIEKYREIERKRQVKMNIVMRNKIRFKDYFN